MYNGEERRKNGKSKIDDLILSVNNLTNEVKTSKELETQWKENHDSRSEERHRDSKHLFEKLFERTDNNSKLINQSIGKTAELIGKFPCDKNARDLYWLRLGHKAIWAVIGAIIVIGIKLWIK